MDLKNNSGEPRDDLESSEIRDDRRSSDSQESVTDMGDIYTGDIYTGYDSVYRRYDSIPDRDIIREFAAMRPQGYKFLEWLQMHRRTKRIPWKAKEQSQLGNAVIENISTHCIHDRRLCYIDDDFVADGPGTRLATSAVEEILASGPKFFLDNFNAWNSEINPPWHNDHPPCSCGSREIVNLAGREVEVCGVCYQIKTRYKQPWYLTLPASATSSQGLCEDCAHIDFNFMFSERCKSIPLNTLQNVMDNRERCNFCCLLGDSLTKHYGEPVRVTADGRPTICTIGSDLDEDERLMSLKVIFQTIPQEIPSTYSDRRATRSDPKQIHEKPVYYSFPIYKLATEANSAGARLVSDTVDFEVIKGWLDGCHNQETVQESLSRSLKNVVLEAHDTHPGFKLRVIDVQDNCIRELPPAARYLALSYVWGGPQLFQSTTENQHMMETHNGLKVSMLPLTLRDAINLVRNVGERYLWVDSLCIIQDDPVMSKVQINAMDQIYEGAVATIIAMTGESADAGLLGMRPAESRRQLRQNVLNMTLVSRVMPMARVAQSYELPCKWSTRAWTFQEHQLSRYCLEFGLDGVKFYYNGGQLKESFRSESYSGAIRSEQFSQPRWKWPVNPQTLMYEKFEGRTNVEGYNTLVEEFSQREVSFATDILNAFAGIQTRLRPFFRGKFIFGLPTTEIDAALLWRPSSSMKRRTHPITRANIFPSWSWSGWVGGVYYDLGDSRNVSMLTWIDPVEDRKFVSEELRDRLGGSKNSQWQPHPPGSLSPSACFEMADPERLYDHPIKPESQRYSVHLLAPESQTLHFEAMSAQFPISGWRVPHNNARLPREQSEFGLFTFDGFLAGFFVTADDVVTTDQIVLREVIALSKRWNDPRGNQMELVMSRRKGDRSNPYEHLALPLKPSSYEAGPTSHRSEYDKTLLTSLNKLITSRYRGRGIYEKDDWEGQLVTPKFPFDTDVFDKWSEWLLYNIMVMEWRDGIAYRVGIGICHVDAFHRADPVHKRIVLG